MDWPGADIVPVVFNAQRPARIRRPQLYVHDANLLVPATSLGGGGVHRSASAAGHRGSASIVINNSQYDEHSPERRSRRRSYHDHHYDSDSWDERSHSHERRRPRSRAGSHRRPSRTPSPFDHEHEKRMQRLADLEKKEEEEAARQRFEEEMVLEEARKAKEKKKEDELKKLAIEEYNAKKLKDELKKKEEKEAADKAFKERVRSTFGAAGYDDESINKILEKEGKGNHGHGPKRIMDLTRPTYIKVHRKHLSPDTLDLYELPWEWDDQNSNYIIIKRWIPEHDQEILFEHTRKLRDGRLLTNTTVELRKERDNLLLVKKKSPSRKRSPARVWMFT